MPVVKHNFAAPLLKEAVVLDLGDLARQGERIVAAARERAERLIREAERQAQKQANAAHDQAQAEGRRQGLAQGVEEGRRQGRKEALSQMQQQLQAVIDAWRELARQWQAMRDELAADSREAVVDFALRFAERVVHRVIEVDPTVVVDQVAAALEHVLQPLAVTVLIHPDDRPVLEEAMPQLLGEFAHLKDVQLKASSEIGRGGCEVRFGQGAVEATVDQQIARIVDLMLPVEEHEPRSAAPDPGPSSKTNPSGAGQDESSEA